MSPKQQRRRDRREAMLDAALRILIRDAVTGLVSLLSVEKVTREAGLPATARRDWEGSRGAGLLTALADERINAVRPATAGEFPTAALSDYPGRDDGQFTEWFVAAMTEYHQIGLEDEITIPGLLLNIVAATSSDLVADGPSANSLAAQLAEGRRGYYAQLTANYAILLDQILADTGHRTVDGIDAATIIRLNQALHEGAMIRQYLEPDAFGEDGAWIARAQLAMVEAFTEPIRVSPDHVVDPLGWVAEMAPTAALSCDRNALTVQDVVAELDRRSDGAIGPELLAELVLEAYPSDLELWDVALRWRLAAIGAALQIRGIRSDAAVLQLVLHRVRDVAITHPGLAAAVCAPGLPNGGPYVTSLLGTVADLLTDLGAPEPELLAPNLVDLALRGHYDVVSTLLGATDLPNPPGGWA